MQSQHQAELMNNPKRQMKTDTDEGLRRRRRRNKEDVEEEEKGKEPWKGRRNKEREERVLLYQMFMVLHLHV